MRSGWIPLALVCAVAIGRAVVARAPERPASLGEAERHEAFRFVTSDEAAERREAATSFPTDPWSRDDDFHKREANRAKDWAKAHHARIEDVLLAVDEGLRAGWPTSNPGPLVATVPPCRPRAIY